jgi:hypothetical protein
MPMASEFTPISRAQRTAAKVAGIAGLFALVVVVIGNYALLNPLIIPRDAVDTARHILAHETQFRLAITFFLLYSTSSIVLLSALYVILKPINHGLALAGALFRLVFASLWLLTTLNLFGALRLIHAHYYLQVLETDRLQAIARTYIAATFDDYYVGLPFFALALTITSWLWLKSKYIPTWLGWFGLISSGWGVFCAFVYLIFPGFGAAVDPYWFDSAMGLFELAVSLWLLFKGIRLREDQSPTQPANQRPPLRLPVLF